MFPLIQPKDEIELLGFHNIYYFEFGKFHHHPTEKHDFWEMVYVDKGQVLANTDGNITTLKEGQAIFHGPCQEHAHVSDREVANNMLVVSFSVKGEPVEALSGKVFTLDKPCKTLLSLFTKEAKDALVSISNDFYNSRALDFSNQAPFSSQLMKMHFTELLIKLIRSEAPQTEKNERYDTPRTDIIEDKTWRIAEYMRENVCNDITLNDICDRFFMRKSHLSAKFKNYCGKSPMEYFRHLKIEEAKKLLREDEMSVSQICDNLGYSSIHNFTRAFKTATGFSPTGYRKSILLLQEKSMNTED